MKTTVLTLLLTLGGASLASAQTQTPQTPTQTGEQKSTSGSSTTTGAGQTSPNINNSPRQTSGSGHIDVNKSPGTPLPARRKP